MRSRGPNKTLQQTRHAIGGYSEFTPLPRDRAAELSHSGDVVLVTVLLLLTGDAPPVLAVLYFLVIAAAALRLSLPLVAVATLS